MERESAVGISRARSKTAPGSTPSRCKTLYLPGKESGHVGHWSTGNAEDSLQSRGVSIRVPSTTLSDIGLDLYQQHVRGSQPRAPPVQLIFQGPFTVSWAFRHSFLWHQAIRNTPAPASPSSPSHPAPKEQVGPTGLLQPQPPLSTTCCAPKSRPFASAPARGHGQG